MTYILDASGLINGFYSKKTLNIMTSSTVAEIKDIKTELLLDELLNQNLLKIMDVSYSDDKEFMDALVGSGDIMRLSSTDKDIVSLALKLKRKGDDITVITDDYSMQNALKLLGINFKSVLTKGINDTIKWQRICKGCRKEYPSDSKIEECEVCGSPIITKRLNAHTNY
ncbi:MAG: ribonuclease VapC [Methanosphaera sp.]|nr:ribonuclease VapC [Methanosphaera sp.]